jgi:hypothetical protein
LYSAAPERRDINESSNEAKAFHEYHMNGSHPPQMANINPQFNRYHPHQQQQQPLPPRPHNNMSGIPHQQQQQQMNRLTPPNNLRPMPNHQQNQNRPPSQPQQLAVNQNQMNFNSGSMNTQQHHPPPPSPVHNKPILSGLSGVNQSPMSPSLQPQSSQNRWPHTPTNQHQKPSTPSNVIFKIKINKKQF